MSPNHQNGCSEYHQLSRRHFLGAAAAAAATLLPCWMPKVAFADDEDSERDVLVCVFLRGGCDGLSLCVPFGDDAYYKARPSLAVPRPGDGSRAATDLDGFFGLPPAMKPLLEAYHEGHLLFAHACGSKNETRSHFDAQHFMEVGKAGDATLRTGWLARHLLSVAPDKKDAIVRAIGMSPGLQQSLVGAPKALPLSDPYDFGLYGDEDTAERRLDALKALYLDAEEPMRTAATNTERVLGLMDSLDLWGYQPAKGAVYQETDFGYALKATAGLLHADAGIEAVAIDLDGWDTHSEQGVLDGGMAEVMDDLASGLAAFHADLIAGAGRKVCVVVMSEFGRVVAENASGGTDHGHGNVMIAMGAGIAGGRVLRKWPGLNRDNLFQGQDLEVTTDYRDILAEILEKRLNSKHIDRVFPGFSPKACGITV